MLLRENLKMDIAAFQSLYPEEVRMQLGRTSWYGEDLQYYNAENETWSNLASSGEAAMFSENSMSFETINGLVKSSIVGGREFAIIVDGDYLGFVRGKNIQTDEDEEMNVEIDWESKGGSINSSDFEASDIFNPENDLRELL